ncbi:MAG: hypothetical protein ACJAZN_002553 [Planctomycetota bacterium]
MPLNFAVHAGALHAAVVTAPGAEPQRPDPLLVPIVVPKRLSREAAQALAASEPRDRLSLDTALVEAAADEEVSVRSTTNLG